jgi:DNA repair exonuclease SbcCD ATPase subunit
MSNFIKPFIILIVVGAFLVAGFFSLAQEEVPSEITEMVSLDEDIQPEDLGIGDPWLLPDSPFYFFKEWNRNIQRFFTFDLVKKVELIEKFANEKLIELKKTVEQKKTRERVEKAIENYQNEVGEAERFTERIRVRAEESEEVEKFLDKFIQHQALHQRVLQKLEEQVPTESFEKIKEARERHLEKFGEVMNKLQENKEQLQERLENNLQGIKGSEFKAFKNLEILEELEEKSPEEAKEAIKNAKENILIKLKEKVEQLPQEKQEQLQEYLQNSSGEAEKKLEILENLELKLEQPLLQQNIIQIRDRILERTKEQEQTQEGIEEIKACITLWDPVCGVNGKTYSNECFANLAGIEIDYMGPCETSTIKFPVQQQTQQQMQKLQTTSPTNESANQ